ncbi:MAG: EAL domain-containing protein [Eubacteriales bacterium]
MDLTTDFSGLFTPQSDELTFEALMDRVQELEERVAMQSIDRLTGVLSTDEYHSAVKRILREYPDEQFVMWRFDIDKFQTVNNLFGVDEGNRLLVYCAKYLMSNTRRDRCTAVGRMGGDVFSGITPFSESGMSSGDEGNHWLTATATLANMESFFKGFRDDFRFSVTIGFYQIENHNDPFEILYSRTLAAAKACKDSSERIYSFYDKALSLAIEEKQIITAEMHSALENGEFTVYLQPKVRLSDLSLVGAEALVRWIHPKKGRIPPDSFIPIFEENGFITKLDLYVLRRCCAYIQSWMRQGLNLIPLSVNLSQMDLSTPGLPFKIQAVLEEYKVAAHYIHLEITESAYADDVEQVNGVTQAFKDLGFHLEMDDFGKGYSSLNMIAELPIDTLKLDMGFLQGDQEGSGKVISFVTGLARHMELTTVAEGIETQEQLAFLRSINCDCGQGYLFSKPMPKAEFDAFMRESNIAAMRYRVKRVDRTVAEYAGWNTHDIWNPDSSFSKMFNVFAGGVGVGELSLLTGEIRLTRYNAALVEVLNTTHELLKHYDTLLPLIHPEDVGKIKEAMTRISDPKDWNTDFGLCQLDLRFQVLKPSHDEEGKPLAQEKEYTWVRVKWRLAEFSAETRSYVILMTNVNSFHQDLEEMAERLEQVDDLERQMAVFSQAGLSGAATLRFPVDSEPEIVYANQHFMSLHSMEEEYDSLQFPLYLDELLDDAGAKAVASHFYNFFQSGEKVFEWNIKRTDKKGVFRNTMSNGRIRYEGDIIYVDLVLSALNEVSALESELHQTIKNTDEILDSADVTVIDFAKGVLHYGSDLQSAYALPAVANFNPAEGFPHSSIFHPDSLAIFEGCVAELLQIPGVKTIEVWMRHSDYVDYSLRRCTFYSVLDKETDKVYQVRGVSHDITFEKYGTENVPVAQIVTHIPDGLVVFSAITGKLLFANQSYYQIIGVSQRKMEEEFKNYPLLLISDEPSPDLALPEIEVEGKDFSREAQLKNHAMRWIEFIGVRQGTYVYGTVRDITLRKELEIQLNRETNFTEIWNNIADELLFRVNIQEKTVLFSGKATASFDLPSYGIPFTMDTLYKGMICEEYEEAYYEMAKDIKNGIEKTYDLQLKMKNGNIAWYRFEYRIVRESGEPAFAIGKALNIDYQVELLEKLERDMLTGTFNKNAMKVRCNQILNSSFAIDNPDAKQEHALLVLRISNYREITSQLNYNGRDELLVQVAERMTKRFRDTDMVGRTAEDTFVIFMRNVANKNTALQKISDLYGDFNLMNTIIREGGKMEFTIRCAYASKDGTSYDVLLKNAEVVPVDMEIY